MKMETEYEMTMTITAKSKSRKVIVKIAKEIMKLLNSSGNVQFTIDQPE